MVGVIKIIVNIATLSRDFSKINRVYVALNPVAGDYAVTSNRAVCAREMQRFWKSQRFTYKFVL